jgi:hypothetical protein
MSSKSQSRVARPMDRSEIERQELAAAVRRKLELTPLRLSEIAEQCGFASSNVVTRRFRFHLKVKPLDYRARFRSSVGPGKSLRKGHPPTKGSPKIPGKRQQGDVSYRSNDKVR